MKRPPEGFHIEAKEAADTYGLTPEEVKEERRARGERVDKRGGYFPPVKNPFDETLKTLGLWDRVKAICSERGVAPHELSSGGRTKRLHAARREVYKLLRGLEWSYPEIGLLFGKDHTTILAALK